MLTKKQNLSNTLLYVAVSWIVTPCSDVVGCRRLGRACCLHFLIPRGPCYYEPGCFSHFFFVFFLFSESCFKWSSCLSFTFLYAFASDAVYAFLLFIRFITWFRLCNYTSLRCL